MSKVDTITVPDELRERINEVTARTTTIAGDLEELRRQFVKLYQDRTAWIRSLVPADADPDRHDAIVDEADKASGFDDLFSILLHGVDHFSIADLTVPELHGRQWIDLGSGTVASPMVSAMCLCGWVANLDSEPNVDTLAVAMRHLAAHRQDHGIDVWAEDYQVMVDDRFRLTAEEIDAAFAEAKAGGPLT